MSLQRDKAVHCMWSGKEDSHLRDTPGRDGSLAELLSFKTVLL